MLTAGLLDTVNGKIPALPTEYSPFPNLVQTQPGYVWRRAMFPELQFFEDYRPTNGGVIPAARTITKLL